MWQAALPYFVWAQANPFELMQRHLNRPYSSKGLGYLLMFGIAVAAIWFALAVWERHRRTPSTAPDERRSLFDQLCERHQLSQEEIGRLRRRAEGSSPADAALLFVDPRLLEQPPAEVPLGERLFGSAFQPAAAPANKPAR